MLATDTSILVAFDRRREQLAEAERERIVWGQGDRLPIARRAARPLGRAMFRLGSWLLRYGKDEHTVTALYQPSVGSVKLN